MKCTYNDVLQYMFYYIYTPRKICPSKEQLKTKPVLLVTNREHACLQAIRPTVSFNSFTNHGRKLLRFIFLLSPNANMMCQPHSNIYFVNLIILNILFNKTCTRCPYEYIFHYCPASAGSIEVSSH